MLVGPSLWLRPVRLLRPSAASASILLPHFFFPPPSSFLCEPRSSSSSSMYSALRIQFPPLLRGVGQLSSRANREKKEGAGGRERRWKRLANAFGRSTLPPTEGGEGGGRVKGEIRALHFCVSRRFSSFLRFFGGLWLCQHAFSSFLLFLSPAIHACGVCALPPSLLSALFFPLRRVEFL